MDDSSTGTETFEEKVERMTKKLWGLPKYACVREFIRYRMAKRGKLEHNLPEEMIDVTRSAYRQVLARKYGVDDRELIRMIRRLRNQKTRLRPLV